MKVRQYVYLGISSDKLDPGVISERVGLMPDEIRLMGSRHMGPPPMPRHHGWRLNSGAASDEVPLDDHFAALVTRLGDSASRLRDLIARDDVGAGIQVVRYFEPGPEDRDISEPGRRVGNLERFSGQHPLVGFSIPAELIRYAAKAGVEFHFDEYGDEDE